MIQTLRRTQGFSLVELAIVLVIIGLIVGGILTGQDLIRSSELSSLQSDANKIKTAVNTFRLKYNGMPGDIINATSYWGAEASCPGSVGTAQVTGTCNGNNNGMIDYTTWTANQEHYRAWEQLTLAGLLPGSYTGRAATASVATAGVAETNMPAHKLNGMYSLLWAQGWASYFSYTGHVINAYGSAIDAAFLTPPEAASIDGKYDDGSPTTGIIFSRGSSTLPGCTSSDTSTATYVLSGTTSTCFISFGIK